MDKLPLFPKMNGDISESSLSNLIETLLEQAREAVLKYRVSATTFNEWYSKLLDWEHSVNVIQEY